MRNTVTSMISILRASQQGEELQYPSKHEVTAMAKRLVEYNPMLQDKDEPIKHVSNDSFSHIISLKLSEISYVIFKMFFSLQISIYSYLQKSIMNGKSPQKRQGPQPERSHSTKRCHIDFSPSDKEEDYDADSSGEPAILLPPGRSSDGDSSGE